MPLKKKSKQKKLKLNCQGLKPDLGSGDSSMRVSATQRHQIKEDSLHLSILINSFWHSSRANATSISLVCPILKASFYLFNLIDF
jgi:hypothetical protein